MPTRFYLKSEAAQKVESGTIKGLRVHYDGEGQPYINRDGWMLRTPPQIEGLVEKVSSNLTFPAKPHRTLGKYEHGTAIAYLDADKGDQERLSIAILSDSTEDLLDLYLQIRAGSIAPVQSWEEPQKSEPAPTT